MAIKSSIYEVCQKCGAENAEIQGYYIQRTWHKCPDVDPRWQATPRAAPHRADVIFIRKDGTEEAFVRREDVPADPNWFGFDIKYLEIEERETTMFGRSQAEVLKAFNNQQPLMNAKHEFVSIKPANLKGE